MKHFKAGDWVLIDGRVGRVTRGSTPDDFHTWIEVDGVMQVVSDVEKLPIKFKGFDIVLQPAGDQLRWDIVRAPRGGSIHIACVDVNGKFHVGMNPSKGKYICNDFFTIEQAKNWLELQYATLLAKARRLV